ncbi:MAG: regulatory iron-sulfur-containing complex subunit RicT [Termitinemataceae bacterium]|nr:MAG: regulatory iron-sulfur-containing complex subunit RicT [Termitinemataceae bacterium]
MDNENDLNENDLNEDYVENEDNAFITDDDDGTLEASLSSGAILYYLTLPYSLETLYGAWDDENIKNGTLSVANTRYGLDIAKITGRVTRKTSLMRVCKIERIATKNDISRLKDNDAKEKEAFDICKEKIAEHKLDMKLVSVHYLLENTKVLFFFTAETRIDFRNLVKDLVSIFRTRIELRQIGIRDETRLIGGLGMCGRKFCCNTYSEKLKPVSIKMAKDQNLSLNSMKISGCCGRLLCCLSYEHAYYAQERKNVPNEGTKITWDGTTWKVLEVNLILGILRMGSEDGRMIQLPKTDFNKTLTGWEIKKK